MKKLLISLMFVLMFVMGSCGAEDEDTGNTGNAGDTGNSGNTGDTGDAGSCPDNNRFCYSHAGLNWSAPATEKMSLPDAKYYCYDMYGKLPTISELRTLIKDCPATVTGGACKVTDDCSDYSTCWSDACIGCSSGGPYSVFKDNGWFLSSSSWRINFDDGHIGAYDYGVTENFRCLEDENRSLPCPDNDLFCHSHAELLWSDVSENDMIWSDAVTYCENMGGRLPTISELRTLIQNCPETEYPKPEEETESSWCPVVEDENNSAMQENGDSCSCNSYYTEGMDMGEYCIFSYIEKIWSSTSYKKDTDWKYYVDFTQARVYPSPSDKSHVLCVR